MVKIDTADIEELVFEAKTQGLTDQEIGERYRVNLRFIEKVVTKRFGVNVSKTKSRAKAGGSGPKNFSLENTTVWSFKARGNWATHNGAYRGNWSPYIPRNIILRYSQPGDTVLDYFCGAGTTGIECQLLKRDFIGLDVNPKAVELAEENLNFQTNAMLGELYETVKHDVRVGDARDLSFLSDESVDLICAHPPYSDIIHYTDNAERDLSFCGPEEFLKEMGLVAAESRRVLKNDGTCTILIGDMRKNKNVVPLGFNLIRVFLNAGFRLKELIIKRQHNCKTTGFWFANSVKYNFLLLAHEYLAVFEKGDVNPINYASRRITDRDGALLTLIPKENLESTTVWVFKPDVWFDRTVENLITRYDTDRYALINDLGRPAGDVKPSGLIIIDATNSGVSQDLENKLTEYTRPGGYAAIIVRDIRNADGTITPLGLEVERRLANNPYLKIKELIVVSIENGPAVNPLSRDLNITHNYVFVYTRVPGKK